jgi:RimJ/RimL family protein N-acetyltransferase
MVDAGAYADAQGRARIRLEPWGEADLPLLQRLLGDPEMMEHLGGPENQEKIAERQSQYQRPDSKQFKIVDDATGQGVGWIGYWERDWRDERVYEIGWSVLPTFQGRGIARSATLEAIAVARSDKRRRFLHAYPSVDNAPSNAICRKLGFVFMGPCDFEYPTGSLMQCNDWRLDLFAST